MNVIQKILPVVLLFLCACGPKTDEVTTEQVDLRETEADSLSNAPKDATATDQTNETPDLVLPQEVISILTQQYPGWKQPVLGEGVRQQVSSKEQGPFMVKGDFDGDNAQDLALQLQHEQQVLMLAFTQQDSAWQMHELKKDILFNERGNMKSLYYLYIAEPETTVRSTETNQQLQTQTEAIAVGLDDRATIYLYESGDFKAYEVLD